ncbi:MAG: hypothetical protein AB1401_02330 [Thermodesulfobacteriota bacterium]
MKKASELPWASGPGEILRHGLSLLNRDTDTNRRLAMISIDNAVELMVKTYLGLPKRITGLSITRREYNDIAESFPALLDGLEKHAPDKLDGIDLGTIEWYHRLRNELYHQGNGLTVERDKIEIYAELANLMFKNLFGEELVPHATPATELLGEFMATWVSIERVMYRLAELTYPDRLEGKRINIGPIPSFLARDKTLDKSLASEIDHLRQIRNQIVHGEADYKSIITADIMTKMQSVHAVLDKKISEIEEKEKQK